MNFMALVNFVNFTYKYLELFSESEKIFHDGFVKIENKNTEPKIADAKFQVNFAVLSSN